LLRLRGSLLWHDFLQGIGDFESVHHNVSYQLLRCLPTLTDRHISRIIADVVNTAMTIVGVQLIDRLGRRRLLLIGAAGMCFCEFIVAIVSPPCHPSSLLSLIIMRFCQVGVTAGNIQADGSVNLAAQCVLIAFVCVCVTIVRILHLHITDAAPRYIAFFATSWGPVGWVVTGEIFVRLLSFHTKPDVQA
jgi:SP family sugar:H+ symporter-like MFS transporter